MSYLWYTWVGFLTAILVGLLVSWITGLNKCKPGDEKLYTPVIRSFLRDSTIITKREQVKLSKIIYLNIFSKSIYRTILHYFRQCLQETVVELEKMDRSVTKV